MKTRIFFAAFTLAASAFSLNSVAQTSNFSTGFNKVNYMAINTEPSSVRDNYLVNGGSAVEYNKTNELNRKALYMASEQYVFDNLGFLKSAFKVDDIYFNLDDASIRPDALPVLDNLVLLMNENPLISVAVSSFADSRMSAYNAKLAHNRAQAAINYLKAKGIAEDRLLISKHGRPDTGNPCNNDPNCSLAVQQLNRRAEFNIVFNGLNLAHIN